jgi:hypothetical protein
MPIAERPCTWNLCVVADHRKNNNSAENSGLMLTLTPELQNGADLDENLGMVTKADGRN